MTIDRTEFVRRAKEVETEPFCQYGIHKDSGERDYNENRICHHCSQFYCGIENDELQAMAEKIGLRADELVFGTEEERRGA
jgi:hypothetical protein